MSKPLAVGDVAPDFELPATSGERVRLADFRGKKNVVVFFYPKDETAGCTVEACTFRDAHEDFVAAGAEVLGISRDSLASHASFAGRHRLPYRLLSDPDGAVGARYGLQKTFGLFPGRVTFVIDRAGTIVHVTDALLRFKQHSDDALRVLRSLPAASAP